MLAQVRSALLLLGAFTLLAGGAYPLLVTGLAQALFPAQASGSLMLDGGQPVGSALIGQPFRSPGYFWGRPSCTAPRPYDATASAGSNLGPANPVLAEAVATRLAELRASDPGNDAPVPIDLVTASASGLDPHISPAAARWQAPRVARARGVTPEFLLQVIEAYVERPPLGILGPARVNVLRLNLALDRSAPRAP